MSREPTCPDESEFAAFAAGRLTRAERREIEAHLDRCSACFDIFGLVGALPNDPNGFGTNVQSAPALRNRLPWKLSDMGAIAATMLATQLFWMRVFLWPTLRAAIAGQCLFDHSAPMMYVASAGLTGCFGVLVGFIAVVGVWKHWKVAPRLVTLQALVSIPTLALAPVALAALYGLRCRRGALSADHKRN